MLIFDSYQDVVLLDMEKNIQKARKTALARVIKMNEPFQCKTLEGVMDGHAGDYLAIGVKDEVYPIAAAVFEASYEIVEETTAAVVPEPQKPKRFDVLTIQQANDESRPFRVIGIDPETTITGLVVEYLDVSKPGDWTKEDRERIFWPR